jgi:hypothetical protein
MKVIFVIVVALFTVSCGKKVTHTEHPQFIFAKLISNEASSVLNDVELYLSSKNDYKVKYKDNLEYHGYEEPFDDEFDFTFVIVESLKANGLAIEVDWREDPQFVLNSLNNISNNLLSSCDKYEELESDFVKTDFNITHYLKLKEPESLLLTCTKSLGLEVIGIDKGTDSYVLALVNDKKLPKIHQYSQQSKVKLNPW